MEILLKPQEESSGFQFDGPLVATRNFLNTFGDKAVYIATQALLMIQLQRVPSGADYLQIVECNSITFWIIDDIDHITALMPEDY